MNKSSNVSDRKDVLLKAAKIYFSASEKCFEKIVIINYKAS